MTVGMEVYDAGGVLQASADLLTHFCRQSGTGVSVANTAGGNATSMIVVSVSGFSKPIVAISCASMVSFAGKFGSSYYYWCDDAIGTAFTYYIFDAGVLPDAHIGLQLYNSSGDITFSSEYYPLQIIEFNPGTTTYSGKKVSAGLFTYGGFEIIGPLMCWQTGHAVPWTDVETSGSCSDLRYTRRVNVRGALIDTADQRISTGNLQYENVTINAGDSSSYTYPDTTLDVQTVIAAIDVTLIPIGETFF